jgi:hypothetical protein
MKEYEVKVIEEKFVYVEASSEEEAMSLAITEAIFIEPDSIDCQIISAVDLDDMDISICGERGCDGCIFQHRGDIDLCKQEAERKNKTRF